jgi:hypothetical protein
MFHCCTYVVYVDKRFGINITKLISKDLHKLTTQFNKYFPPEGNPRNAFLWVTDCIIHSGCEMNKLSFSVKATASLNQHMIVHLKHDLESFLSKLSSLNLRKSMNLVESSYKTHSLFFHLLL